jgi:nucleoside-diphosphate-sugar epimerase
VVLDFLNKLRADTDELEILGSGRQLRDFNYVADTADGLLTLAKNGLAGETYNLASGRSYSVTELAHILLRILGLEDKTSLRYTGSSWQGDAQRWEVSVDKARDAGCRQTVTLEEGLRRVVTWYLATTGPCEKWSIGS